MAERDAKKGRAFYWVSGFAFCGAIKVAFEGDWLRVAMLLAVVALTEIAAWDISRDHLRGEQ